MGRQSRKKKDAVVMLSDWFWDCFMKNQNGMVTIDDFSRKFTELKIGKQLAVDEYISDLKTKSKTDAEAFEKLSLYAKHGYTQKLNHELVAPVRNYYETVKDEQGFPVRMIYSVKRAGAQAWTFINFKDEEFFNQTAVKNFMMTDAYTDNEKKLYEKALHDAEHAKTEKERIAAIRSLKLFINRVKKY